MVVDLADGVVQALESLADGLPGYLTGLAGGGLQAEPYVVESGDDRVEVFLAAVPEAQGARDGGSLRSAAAS
jgi:hypothetical protein